MKSTYSILYSVTMVALMSSVLAMTGCDRIKDVVKPEPELQWQRGFRQTDKAEWYTRNLVRQQGLNRDRGCEWIISRIEGRGFQRLLIMQMCGGRQSRIYFQDAGGRASESDGLFAQDMAGPSHWQVVARDGRLRVVLDGAEIWSRPGNFSVDRVFMGGYPNRELSGEWAVKK